MMKRREFVSKVILTSALVNFSGLASRIQGASGNQKADRPFIRSLERKKDDTGGEPLHQPILAVWGWKVEMQENDHNLYDLFGTNSAPFHDPAHPADQVAKQVRITRCKPEQGFWKREGQYIVPPGKKDLALFTGLRADNEDNLYYAEAAFGPNDWRLFNADNISGLSNASIIENGNAVKIDFGGSQPISITLRGREV